MDILYPRIPRHRLWPMGRVALLGAVIAGAYGAVHDQISYTISPEYFTKLKFDQFAWANVGLPERAFASEVGFLASWWVGLFAGWFLARIGLVDLIESSVRYPVVKSFVIVAVVAVIFGLGGGLFGVWATRDDDLSAWRKWATILKVSDVRAFAIVAYLHLGSYIGAAVGFICAAIYVRRSVSGIRCKVADSSAISASHPVPTTASPQRGGRQ